MIKQPIPDSPVWFERVGCMWPDCCCFVPIENFSHEKRERYCEKVKEHDKET